MIMRRLQSSRMTPHKIMIVDDNSATRQMVRNALAGKGHYVIEAADGKTARDLMRSECPQLVLQDIMLPDADGLRFVGELRDIAQSGVSILALIGFESKLNELHVSKLGFDDVIAKPIAPSRLVPLVEAHLPDASAIDTIGRRKIAPGPVGGDSGLANRCSLLASELTVLTGIAETVLRHRDVDSALEDAMVSCFDARGIAYGALYTLDGSTLHCRQLGGSTETRAPIGSFFDREDIVRAAIEAGQTVYVPSSDVPESQGLLYAAAAQAILVVPLPSAAGPFGALMMVSRNRNLEENDWRVFSHGVAMQISHVLTLAKAYKDLATVEAKAARQAALLEAIVENAPDYVTQLDRDGIIRFVNRVDPPERPQDVVGQSWFGRVIPEQQELARRTFDAVLATGKPAELELTFPNRTGDWRWFQLRIGAVRDNSAASGCVIVARDITENKHNELQLMVADRMASVGTLAAGVGYEINNPLAAVIANLDIAEQDLVALGSERSLPVDLIDAIRDARLSADRVRDIVRDLKVFSRMREDVRGAVNVENVLDSSLRLARNELRHRAKVQKFYQRVPRVDANEGQLGQVFLNIIVNAAQAIPEGNYANNTIRVTTELERDLVVISIADTGVGMSPEVYRRLFTPFFTTKPAGVGTGLGLATSYRIISDYGGTIECQTELHKGTTFRVKLPIAPENLAPVPRKVHLASPPKRRGRVLIIDDEESLVQAIRRYLSPEHDVDGVTSARVAIEMLATGTHYDAIVCDLMMPQITGMDVHAAVMKLDPGAADRIVFMTGGAFIETARAFLDRSPNVRLEKPFDLKTLRSVINDLVR